MLPTVKEMAQYGMLIENPLFNLKKYQQGLLERKNIPRVRECPQCHLYTEGHTSSNCSNCGHSFS
jgi:hypothetical protein